MALVPEADDDERSDGDVDEIDLLAYEQDPWDDAADFLHQQRARVGGAAGGMGFLVAGKPGAGKAHLAEKLAAELGAVHVGLPQILSLCVQAYSLQVRHDALSKELADEQAKAPIAATAEGAYNDEEGGGGSGDGGDGPDPEKVSALQGDAAAVLAEWAQLPLPPRVFKAAGEFAEAAAALMAGKAVEGDLLSRLLVARLRCPDVMFRGYVLESLPPPLLPDMLLQDGLPKLEYVLVIELTEEECKARLQSLQLEPVANRLFSLGDRTPGDHQPLVEEVDAEGNPVTDADGAPVMVHETPPVLDRWVRRVHDMPDAVAARMAHYASVTGRGSESWQSVLDALLPGRLIRLDGSLSPHRLLHSAKQALGFERYPIVQAPRILQQHLGDSNQTDTTPDLKTLDDLVKVYNGDGEEQTLCGPLSLSAWGPFCPVALSEAGAASLGRSCRAMLDASMTDAGVAKPKYAAEYCGKVFMLSSREALQMFVANPLPYVSEAAEVPRVRVLVLGPPCVGKSEVARSLAARYDAQHVDALKMLEMHVLESGGEGSDETMASLVGGKGVPPAQLTRMLARQLGLPEPDMPAPPAPPPPPAEGEETADADAKFELPVWSAKSEPDEVGVIEWGAAPPGQEALRFVFDGLPLDLQQAEDGSQASPTVDALRTAALVPTVVLILDDEPAGEEGEDACVGRGRTDEAKESGFFYNLGREALLERDTGVMFPFNEARDLQSAHLAPGSALCTQLTDAGAKILRLSGRMRLAELVEAAAARIDPLIYGKDLDVPDGPLLGATKIDSYEPSSVLGTVSDAGEPVAETEGMQVLGHLKGFCPVTWRRSHVFVPGRPEFAARWRGLLYLFKGEEEQGAFLENPAYYAPCPVAAPEHCFNSPLQEIWALPDAAQANPAVAAMPALRLMLIGPLGSHRQKHVAHLSQTHGLDVINLDAALPAKPPGQPASASAEEAAECKTEWAPEDMKEMAENLAAKLATPPLASTAVLLEGEPLSEAMVQALVEANLHPHMCVLLGITAETAVQRVFGSKDAEGLQFPKPHRLPFYPYLDTREQRRELRALKQLGVDPPNPNPRDPETGKPIEPAPTAEELAQAAVDKEAEVKNLLTARVTSSLAAMDGMKAVLTQARVLVKGVNAEASWEKKEEAIERATAAFLKHPASALASPTAVTPAKAATLLSSRVRRLSKFGSSCPVMLPRYGRLVSPSVKVPLADSFPVVYGPHVYMCKTAAAREAFMADCVPLSRQRPPQPAALQRIVVLGPPKSGKSSLAASIARDLGLVCIDACSAVEQVLEGISHLSLRVRSTLRKGEPLDEYLLAECVCAVALQSPGWVLDGFPSTRDQADLIASRSLDITKVLILNLDDDEAFARAEGQLLAKDSAGAFLFPTPGTLVPDTREDAEEGSMVEVPGAEAILAGKQAIGPALSNYKSQITAICAALAEDRDRVQVCTATGNRSKTYSEVKQKLVGYALGRQAYLEKRARFHPAPLLHQRLWMDRGELVRKRSRFSRAGGGDMGGDRGGDYCPVSWKMDRALVLCCPDQDLSNMLQVEGQMVCVAAKYRRELLASPKYYMRGAPLPAELPHKLGLDEALAVEPGKLEYKGYCPVTLYDGPGIDQDSKQALPIQDAIKKPSMEDSEESRGHVVCYRGKYFRMLSADKLERFMRTPWTFDDLALPVKLPLQAPKIDLSALPLMGYLEQTVVEDMTASMLNLGRDPPRFPGLSGSETALKYLALHLRAHKGNSSPVDARLHAQNLKAFKDACDILKRDAVGAQLPTPLKPADPLVDRYFELKEAGPKAVANK